MSSLQSFQPVSKAPEPPPPRKIVGAIREASDVVLTQPILYRNFGGKDKLIRPGHKMLPRGAVGVVKTVADDGKSFQVELRKPVVGTLHVVEREIKILERSR